MGLDLGGCLMEEYRTYEKIHRSSFTWGYSSGSWDLTPWREPLAMGKPAAR